MQNGNSLPFSSLVFLPATGRAVILRGIIKDQRMQRIYIKKPLRKEYFTGFDLSDTFVEFLSAFIFCLV